MLDVRGCLTTGKPVGVTSGSVSMCYRSGSASGVSSGYVRDVGRPWCSAVLKCLLGVTPALSPESRGTAVWVDGWALEVEAVVAEVSAVWTGSDIA